MLTSERHAKILSFLKEKHNATVHQLSEETGASVSTIRRDLEQLEKEKKLKRVHGGATYIQSRIHEPNITEKSKRNQSEKEAIGKYAASLVKGGDSLFLDAGTTTKAMIPYLHGKDIVVVTNSYSITHLLTQHNISTFLIGGKVKLTTGALIGPQAEVNLQQYRFDKCFIGMNGIDLKYGYTTPDPEEARIKQKAIDLSKQAFILADHSKFTEIAFSKVADIEQAQIITDINVDDQHLYESRTKISVVKQ